jgi:hypothetical protein
VTLPFSLSCRESLFRFPLFQNHENNLNFTNQTIILFKYWDKNSVLAGGNLIMEGLKLVAPCGFTVGFVALSWKELVMVVDVILKIVLRQKSIRSVPFINVSEKKVFKIAHHAMISRVPS